MFLHLHLSRLISVADLSIGVNVRVFVLYMSALWWTGHLSRVYPTAALCQLWLAIALNNSVAVLMLSSCILSFSETLLHS